MKKVNDQMKYNELKVIAKELGVKFVGVKTENLVIAINEEIEKRNEANKEKTPKVKKEKWYTDGYGFEPEQVVEIISKTIEKSGVTKEILQGRKASIIGPSANEGMVKALLFDEKTGELLNCPITLEITKIKLVEKVENKEEGENTAA